MESSMRLLLPPYPDCDFLDLLRLIYPFTNENLNGHVRNK